MCAVVYLYCIATTNHIMTTNYARFNQTTEHPWLMTESVSAQTIGKHPVFIQCPMSESYRKVIRHERSDDKSIGHFTASINQWQNNRTLEEIYRSMLSKTDDPCGCTPLCTCMLTNCSKVHVFCFSNVQKNNTFILLKDLIFSISIQLWWQTEPFYLAITDLIKRQCLRGSRKHTHTHINTHAQGLSALGLQRLKLKGSKSWQRKTTLQSLLNVYKGRQIVESLSISVVRPMIGWTLSVGLTTLLYLVKC